jgi:serine/threonine protein kinase
MTEREIFIAARQLLDPIERDAYLDKACSGDPELHGRIVDLLAEQQQLGSFMEHQPPRAAAIDSPPAETQGTVIGPYKLIEQIGEGGFGVVFLAEQTEPVRRNVALKVLKPGMDTRQVVARFEAERQALAMMDHPNIAKVFDGGTTGMRSQGSGVRNQQQADLTPDSCLMTPDLGRPFFVMELFQGVPITDYSDQNRLTPRQRLELFIPVCQAVQHAHQKGIIHRDLKPSNVLVTQVDGRPVPKVIDFGVAKATGQELTDKSLFTGVAQMIGTPLYMSPEQAGQGGLDIDTRSDIYSLGVLLYELLTGTTPFDKVRFQQAAYDEVRRIIREEEPPKPSTRLSDSTQSLPSISAQRQTEPARLTKLVRGELDWIVMKAMEKERDRRYETANSMVMDLQHYLADEPVQACPPSTWYRFRKFARRNKRMMATAAVTAAALLTTVVVLSVSTRIVLRQQAETKAALAQAQQQRNRAEANFDGSLNAMTDLLSLLDRRDLADLPRIGEVRSALAQQIEHYYKRFLNEESTDPTVRFETARAYISLGTLYEAQGNLEDAEQARRKAIILFEALAAGYREDPVYWKQLGHSRHFLGGQLERRGLIGPATEEYRKAIAAFGELMRLEPDSHWGPYTLAWVLVVSKIPEVHNPLKAVELAGKATELAPEHPGCWNTLGMAHYYAGNWQDAIAALNKALEFKPDLAYSLVYLAMSHEKLGHKQEARRWLDKAREWMNQKGSGRDGHLRRMRTEAEAVLGSEVERKQNSEHQKDQSSSR